MNFRGDIDFIFENFLQEFGWSQSVNKTKQNKNFWTNKSWWEINPHTPSHKLFTVILSLLFTMFLFKAAHIVFKHTNVSVQDNDDVLLIHSALRVIWNRRRKYVEDDTLFLRLSFDSVWASSTAEAENVPTERANESLNVWPADQLQLQLSSFF